MHRIVPIYMLIKILKNIIQFLQQKGKKLFHNIYFDNTEIMIV